MSKAEEIETHLRDALAVDALTVRNDSARHGGHSGDDGSGESHFHVTLCSPDFAGKSRIARHRMVHAALGADLVAAIHALGLDLSAPEQAD